MERSVLLLYMSPFGKNPNIHTQTNEAAVLELKKHKEGPDCILALCSELVRTSPTVHLPDGKTCTTVEYFRDVFLPSAGIPAERLVVIPVPDSMDDKAQFRAISLLLGKIEAEDTLSIDLSGGMRDTAMLLVTAARCMRDLRSVETRRVIYSELLSDGTSRIHDSSQLYSLFDLITAMDEFFSTGTAQKLKGYLWSEGESDPALHTLLARINQFSDDLALCRVQALNEDLSQIAQALQAPPKESKNLTSLFFHLLNDRFRTEFEGLLASPKNNLPALVSWCAEHRMYQQALTLLCEQMPAYVCRHLFVQPTETGWAYLAAQNQNKGKAWVYPLFHFHFCRLTLMQKEYPYTTDLRLTHSKDDADGNMLFGVANSKEMHAYMDTVLASGQLVIDPEVRWQIEDAALFYQRVMQYRNQINHASDTAFGLQSDRILPLDTAHIEQTLQDVADYLQERLALEATEGGLAEVLHQAAEESVQAWLPDAFDELQMDVAGTFLEDLDEQNQKVEFRELMTNSVWYVLLNRCGLDVQEYLDAEDFRHITDFNQLKVLGHLGSAVNEISRPVLMQIGRYVLNDLEKDLKTVAKEKEVAYNEFNTLIRESNTDNAEDREEKKEETDYERDQLQPERRVSDSGYQPGRDERNHREVRNDEERVSEKPQGSQVQHSDIAEPSGQSPDGDRQSGKAESSCLLYTSPSPRDRG